MKVGVDYGGKKTSCKFTEELDPEQAGEKKSSGTEDTEF